MMLGVIYAIIAAVIGAIESILFRKVVKSNSSHGFHFLWALFSSILLIPAFAFELFANSFSFPVYTDSIIPWILLVISGAVWTFAGICGFLAYKYMQVSLKAPISKIKIIFSMLLAIIFLGESATFTKVIGTLLVFFGVFFINYKNGMTLKAFFDKGTILTIAAAFLVSTAMILDKYAGANFGSGTYGFLVFGLTPIYLLPYIILKRKKETLKILKTKLTPTLISALIGAVTYYLVLEAFKITDASIVIPIKESSTLLTVIGGIIFLGEKEDVFKKIVMSIVIVIGVILISGVF